MPRGLVRSINFDRQRISDDRSGLTELSGLVAHLLETFSALLGLLSGEASETIVLLFHFAAVFVIEGCVRQKKITAFIGQFQRLAVLESTGQAILDSVSHSPRWPT